MIKVSVHTSFKFSSEGQNELPESKYLRVENKVFYFDVGSNRRGVYLRISEVSIFDLNYLTVTTGTLNNYVNFQQVHGFIALDNFKATLTKLHFVSV